MQYTEREIKRRYGYVSDALANLRLEGLDADPRTIEDLMAEARGEITLEEVRARVYARIKAGTL